MMTPGSTVFTRYTQMMTMKLQIKWIITTTDEWLAPKVTLFFRYAKLPSVTKIHIKIIIK